MYKEKIKRIAIDTIGTFIGSAIMALGTSLFLLELRSDEGNSTKCFNALLGGFKAFLGLFTCWVSLGVEPFGYICYLSRIYIKAKKCFRRLFISPCAASSSWD